MTTSASVITHNRKALIVFFCIQKDVQEAIAWIEVHSIPLDFGARGVYDDIHNMLHSCSPNTYYIGKSEVQQKLFGYGTLPYKEKQTKTRKQRGKQGLCLPLKILLVIFSSLLTV